MVVGLLLQWWVCGSVVAGILVVEVGGSVVVGVFGGNFFFLVILVVILVKNWCLWLMVEGGCVGLLGRERKRKRGNRIDVFFCII